MASSDEGPVTKVIGGIIAIAILCSPLLLVFWSAYTGYTAVSHGRSASIWSWMMFIVALAVVCVALGIFLGWLGTLCKHDGLGVAVGLLAMVGLFIGGIIEVHAWTSSHSDTMVKALGPVCRGQGVPEAAATGAGGRLLILNDQGHKNGWTYKSSDINASRIEEVALVACVDRHDRFLSTSSYRYINDSGDNVVDEISRYANVVDVRVVIARTSKTLDTFTLEDKPGPTPEQAIEGDPDLYGEVPFSSLESKLKAYLNGD